MFGVLLIAASGCTQLAQVRAIADPVITKGVQTGVNTYCLVNETERAKKRLEWASRTFPHRIEIQCAVDPIELDDEVAE